VKLSTYLAIKGINSEKELNQYLRQNNTTISSCTMCGDVLIGKDKCPECHSEKK
jgi:rubrerythrin